MKEALDEVREADDAIVRIANLLPHRHAEEQIVSARKSLTRSIMSLTSRIRSVRRAEHDEPPRE